MKKKPIYIIADHIISSLGENTASNIAQIAQEKSCIKEHHAPSIYPHFFWASRLAPSTFEQASNRLEQPKNYTRLEQLFLWSINEVLEESKIDIKAKDTLIILASTKGNIELLESKNKDKFPKNRLLLGEMAEQIQTYFGNPNIPLVVCNACISGLVALDLAKSLLQKGRYTNIIVSGGDLLTEFVVSGFQSFHAMSSAACRPYDKDRKGINLGEAVGTVLLSNNRPHHNEIISLEGGASSNDANHISGPSRSGDGLAMAIQKALKEAQINGQKLQYISMHGTATIYNDEMEAKALDLTNLRGIPANSLKAYFGHTLGAAGLIESIVAIQSLRNNTLYRSLGFEHLGVSLALNIIEKTEKKELEYCLKTASGFGGCNAAIVFRKQKNKA